MHISFLRLYFILSQEFYFIFKLYTLITYLTAKSNNKYEDVKVTYFINCRFEWFFLSSYPRGFIVKLIRYVTTKCNPRVYTTAKIAKIRAIIFITQSFYNVPSTSFGVNDYTSIFFILSLPFQYTTLECYILREIKEANAFFKTLTEKWYNVQ